LSAAAPPGLSAIPSCSVLNGHDAGSGGTHFAEIANGTTTTIAINTASRRNIAALYAACQAIRMRARADLRALAARRSHSTGTVRKENIRTEHNEPRHPARDAESRITQPSYDV
jgi:hypothetical protein